MFLRILQKGDADLAIRPSVAAAEMGADAMPGRSGIRIITVVQNHQLDVAVDGLDWVIIRTSLGQADPMQSELPNHPAGLPRLARMRPILVQYDPYLLLQIPVPHPDHKPADLLGVLGLGESPSSPPAVGLVNEVKADSIELQVCGF